ncbi:hypothetical protein N0V87_007459 [Didymella glomerata]|uniref:Uncharacterized protein n=1 Tax=Didymella glomerata TaxID=749621 RepID=A0A9W9BYW7_9PLEO|nr:hypothetical protein N0V87_007459 [Didymella glomerata]
MELGPVDYLTQVVSLLAKLPGGAKKFVPLLIAKVNELRPELVSTLCTATQQPLGAFSGPMSPDTQYIYEEEVGRASYTDDNIRMDFRMDFLSVGFRFTYK